MIDLKRSQKSRLTTDGSQDLDVVDPTAQQPPSQELRQIRDAGNMGGELEPGPQTTRRVATPAAMADALSRLVHNAHIPDREEICPICLKLSHFWRAVPTPDCLDQSSWQQ